MSRGGVNQKDSSQLICWAHTHTNTHKNTHRHTFGNLCPPARAVTFVQCGYRERAALGDLLSSTTDFFLPLYLDIGAFTVFNTCISQTLAGNLHSPTHPRACCSDNQWNLSITPGFKKNCPVLHDEVGSQFRFTKFKVELTLLLSASVKQLCFVLNFKYEELILLCGTDYTKILTIGSLKNYCYFLCYYCGLEVMMWIHCIMCETDGN